LLNVFDSTVASSARRLFKVFDAISAPSPHVGISRRLLKVFDATVAPVTAHFAVFVPSDQLKKAESTLANKDVSDAFHAAGRYYDVIHVAHVILVFCC
jgi:hypothetical protein